MSDPRDPETEARIHAAVTDMAAMARDPDLSGASIHDVLRKHWPQPQHAHPPQLALDVTDAAWAIIQRPQPPVTWEELFHLVSQQLRGD